MRSKLITTIIISVVLLVGCGKPKEGAHKTPSGVIEKDYTKEQVVKVMGHPQHMTSKDGIDTWYYKFEDGKSMFVYFMDDRLIEVWQKSLEKGGQK